MLRAVWDSRLMRVGLDALGIGPGARRSVIDAVAVAAESCGFATLWSGEHVVMVDSSSSRYPYSSDGRIAVPSTAADWIDPMIGLSFAAAATSTIGIATGVLLLPENNPLAACGGLGATRRATGTTEAGACVHVPPGPGSWASVVTRRQHDLLDQHLPSSTNRA